MRQGPGEAKDPSQGHSVGIPLSARLPAANFLACNSLAVELARFRRPGGRCSCRFWTNPSASGLRTSEQNSRWALWRTARPFHPRRECPFEDSLIGRLVLIRKKGAL